MAVPTKQQLEQLQGQLQSAVVACNDRCLYQSAKWVAELLNSFGEELNNVNDDGDTDIDSPEVDGMRPSVPLASAAAYIPAPEARLERKDLPKYMMAKSFFDCREYDRCATTLLPNLLPQLPLNRNQPKANLSSRSSKGKGRVSSFTASYRPTHADSPKLSQKALFLALYAKFIAGEKRKEEDSEMILGPADGPVTQNKELPNILAILEEYFIQRDGDLDVTSQGEHRSNAFSDGFLEYLYAVILIKMKQAHVAKRWLLRSVSKNPWLWAAWQELTGLIASIDELTQVLRYLKPSLATLFFRINCSQELYQTSPQVFANIDELSSIFPTSAFLATQRALLFYHAKDFSSASNIFSSLLTTHPYRLDSLDAYSNILYVIESSRPQLAYLASLTSSIDKFRPETCCVLGNHYSKSSEHEKSVMYFRRALTLDRSFLSAWTLMGHEYIELKNTQAAIESYRRAVDANNKDYRAWHGLGLGYELLDMNSYALYYYNRAASLQPWDPKMWTAVAGAAEKCGKLVESIKAYKRAIAAQSRADAEEEGFESGLGTGLDADPMGQAIGGRLNADLLYHVALLYEELGDEEEAAAFMELCLAQEEGAEEELGASTSGQASGIGVTQTTSRARLWLSKRCFAKRDWQRAMQLANELCQDGFEVEEAKALIRDVRARLGVSEQ